MHCTTIPTMQKTFMSFVFGCRVNEAEKQLLDDRLAATGFLWDEKNPTFYIINSCAVTGKAEREVRQHIYQTRKKFPKTTIVVTGCSATLWMKNNMKPEGADYWIDNKEKQNIVPLLTRLTNADAIPNSLAPLSGKQSETDARAHDKFLQSGRMMVKIQDGCSRFCSYCIVPYLRNPIKSQFIASILKLIHDKSKYPIKEVILTAINTEMFGKDTGETLPQLLDAILTETKIERVSFGSIHPWSITPEFLAWYKKNKKNPRFVHFFHIPIQSGSDTVLTRMNRHYTTKQLTKMFHELQSIDPFSYIATDVIVGFPGETEKEFQETYDFLKESPISKFHVFRYAQRPGTAAEHRERQFPQLSPREKINRSKRLTKLGTQKYTAFLKSLIGYVSKVFLIKRETKFSAQGILGNQIPVYYKTSSAPVDTLQNVKITRIKDGNVYGNIF